MHQDETTASTTDDVVIDLTGDELEPNPKIDLDQGVIDLTDGQRRIAAPGAYVLGMHRSGTSVLAGVLDHLGLDAGPRDLMFDADQFNSDGYWERRDVVEFHDQGLRVLGGWASAPPAPIVFRDERLAHMAGEVESMLDCYDGPWMIKDPRHCLMLPTWHAARGDRDLHIIAVRHPNEVQRSLARRNGYRPELGVALWERYMYDALRNSRDRRTLIVSYDELTGKPYETIETIADALTGSLLEGQAPSDGSLGQAIGLVRPSRPKEIEVDLGAECAALYETLMDQRGYHERLEVGTIRLSGSSRQEIDRRRRRLAVVAPLGRSGAVLRGRLDRRLAPR